MSLLVSSIANSSTCSVQDDPALQTYINLYKQYQAQYKKLASEWNSLLEQKEEEINENIRKSMQELFESTQNLIKSMQKRFADDGEIGSTHIGNIKQEKLSECAQQALQRLSEAIAAAQLLSGQDIDPDALKKLWEQILQEGGKQYLSQEFIQAINGKFELLTQKMDELEKAIEEKDVEKIAELTKQVDGIKSELNAIINGSSNPSVLSLKERIVLLKELKENRENMDENDYASLRKQLLELDLTQQITEEQFKTKLLHALNQQARKKAEESLEEIHNNHTNSIATGEMLKTSIAMKVLQAKNKYREIDWNNKAEKKLQENSEFNPILRKLRDNGIWETQSALRQQEMAQEQHNQELKRNEKTLKQNSL